MILLGLDISTSVTAYTLVNTDLSQNDCVEKFEGIHLSKFKSIYDKAEIMRETFRDLKKEYNIEGIYAEEALQSFRRGLSSAKTLSTLTRFNGIVCYLAEDIFKCPVNLINVIHARSALGIKINRKSDISTKEQVLNWVEQTPEFSQISWPVKTMKSGPRKNQTVKDKSCYDIADAGVMSLYGMLDIKNSLEQ